MMGKFHFISNGYFIAKQLHIATAILHCRFCIFLEFCRLLWKNYKYISIEDLIEKKILPPMIGDACWIIRQMGNDAAHADKVDVFAIEVDQVIGYVATIIDYLYSMPFRVSKMKQKIEDRKNKKK